ncbi:cold shock domain-containing protein [Paenibacillus whitsoniae]|uniref:cold shock domain-containing protein n=1 Tax=Paenibacillus whitsoniae TaxID=2496558 RepID=UPI003B973C1D
MRGQVSKFSDFKGYGFIKGEDGIDYFVHISQIISDGFRTLKEGQLVEYEPAVSQRGPQARAVHIVTKEIDSTNQKIVLKRNPFSPQDPITDPSKFAGRKEAFINAVSALYNNKNVLVHGPRGIGKSSISYQLTYLTQGETSLLEKLNIDLDGYVFNYLAGRLVCTTGTNLNDIVNGLLGNLYDSIDSGNFSGETKSKIELNLNLLKISKEKTEKNNNPTELSSYFVSEIKRIYNLVSHNHNGITLLIDEIDLLEDKVDIGSFLKATIEMLRVDYFGNISFIISGVTGITTSLITQHPSSTRLFDVLELQRMKDEELEEIIDLTLHDTGYSMNNDAKRETIALANRFPQPIHLIGFYAFNINKDKVISLSDVLEAKQYLITNLKRQDFDNKFQGLKEGVMVDVLRVLVSSSFETINLSFLFNRLPDLSHSRILGTLGTLEQKDIIERQHRGVYRFRDPLFRVYLEWYFGVNQEEKRTS